MKETSYIGCERANRCNLEALPQWRCEACNTYLVACSRPHNWSPIVPMKSYDERLNEYFARLKEELKEEQGVKKA